MDETTYKFSLSLIFVIDIVTNRVKHPYNQTHSLKYSIENIKTAYDVLKGESWYMK